MRVAMTYPPWLAQAYAKPVDPERGSRRQSLAETGNIILDDWASVLARANEAAPTTIASKLVRRDPPDTASQVI
jgi:hypothetical protein